MGSIFERIEADDVAGVEALLRRNSAAAGARDDQGVSAVRRAAYRRRALLDAVLAAGPPLDGFDAAVVGDLDRLAAPDEWSEDGFTPLHLAVFGGQLHAARVLLERGADTEAMSRHELIKVRPLHTAAFVGETELARILLEHRADPNGRAADGGGTALHSAAQNGNAALVRLLLEYGADPEAHTDDGRTPADLAADAETAALLRG
jgi:uncharacterized protein